MQGNLLISQRAILSKMRCAKIVKARRFIALHNYNAGLSMKEILALTGYKARQSVMSAVEALNEEMSYNATLKAEFELFTKNNLANNQALTTNL